MRAQIYLEQDNKWKPFELETAEAKQILKEKNIVIHPLAVIGNDVHISADVSIGEDVTINRGLNIVEGVVV